MDHCRDCRFWSGGQEEEGTCYRPFEDGALFRPDPSESGSEQVDVDIITRADFGCVQFESKES